MLRFTEQLRGRAVQATDGEVGKVKDCYFDDREWVIRYLVVDTGGWLSGRRVLLSPASVSTVSAGDEPLQVNLTKDKIEHAPSTATDLPVSRQIEEKLTAYYGWPTYWGTSGMLFGAAATMEPPPTVDEAVQQRKDETAASVPGDPHLRSMTEVAGYHIQATNDEVGHVEDFIVDPAHWATRFVMVDTRNWLPGRKVLVSPQWFTSVDWGERKAYTDLTREAIKESPPYNPAEPFDEDLAAQLHDFHGRPNTWSSAAPGPLH